MITANILVTAERSSSIHYQCPFGSGSNGWIRTKRDPQLSITDISQLNKTGIMVGGKLLIIHEISHSLFNKSIRNTAYEGTAFATYVKTNLPAATFVPYSGINLQYEAVLDGSVHAIIGDGKFNFV